MLTAHRNVALNPFVGMLEDYGTAVLSADGMLSTRWTWDNTAGCTAQLVSAPADGPVWLRTYKSAQFVVTASGFTPSGATGLYQKIDDSRLHGQVTVRMSVWAQGTSGGSFLYGIGGRYATATTTGLTGASTWQRYTATHTFDDVATFLKIEPFIPLADLDATYRVGYVMVEYQHGEFNTPIVPELRNKGVERLLCLPYCRPVGRFARAWAINDTTIAIPVECWPQLRASPVPVTIASSVLFKVNVGATSEGVTTFNAASPTIALGAAVNGDRGVHGGVLTVAGFTGLSTAKQPGYIATDVVALLEAEIA